MKHVLGSVAIAAMLVAPGAHAAPVGLRDLAAARDAVTAVRIAGAVQANDLGIAVTTPAAVQHATPSAAATAILLHHRVTPDRNVGALDALPASVARPLTDVLDA